ncbi:MAG: hypothetical protein IJL06_09410 [Kiritimatiellae bacterium]|nr:hypothetical protein [Kiritimatiellia bacterium]
MNGFGKTALALVGVAAVAAVSSLVTIAVCGGGESLDAAKAREWHRRKIDEMAKVKGGRPDASAAAPKRLGRADRTLATFRDPKGNFTMQVPKGWVVSSGGFDLLHWIHACDPKKPELGVFVLLKTECLLMNRSSKRFYWDKRGFGLYAMFADMIVVEKVEDFYAQFPAFCAFAAKWEKSYAGFAFPQIADFELVEKKPARTAMSRVARDDALLRGTFTDPLTKRRGEGLFTGTLCPGVVMGNVGCNVMYNISGVTAPEGELGEWAATLAEVLGSVRYSEAFEATAARDAQIRAAGNAKLAQTLQETSDLVVRGWEERQKGFDARVGKRADATMGYERVVEKDSGKVYRAYNGFLDASENQKRFQTAPDEAYSRPVEGTIER